MAEPVTMSNVSTMTQPPSAAMLGTKEMDPVGFAFLASMYALGNDLLGLIPKMNQNIGYVQEATSNVANIYSLALTFAQYGGEYDADTTYDTPQTARTSGNPSSMTSGGVLYVSKTDGNVGNAAPDATHWQAAQDGTGNVGTKLVNEANIGDWMSPSYDPVSGKFVMRHTGSVGTKSVDETNFADGKILMCSDGQLIYVAPAPAPKASYIGIFVPSDAQAIPADTPTVVTMSSVHYRTSTAILWTTSGSTGVRVATAPDVLRVSYGVRISGMTPGTSAIIRLVAPGDTDPTWHEHIAVADGDGNLTASVQAPVKRYAPTNDFFAVEVELLGTSGTVVPPDSVSANYQPSFIQIENVVF